jgi:hypothetical protein
MTRRAWCIAAVAFFLIASTISGFFSYASLEIANKWSGIISMFLTLASFTLSALLCHQSTARRPPVPPAPKTTPSSEYSATPYGNELLHTGNNQAHNTIVNKDNNDGE